MTTLQAWLLVAAAVVTAVASALNAAASWRRAGYDALREARERRPHPRPPSL